MFEDTKAVLFALDGTIYHGSQLIEGAADAVRHCRDLGKAVCFLTNNSSETRSQIFHKVRDMGIDCTFREMLTSGYIAALYAHREKLPNVYVCGSRNLISEFEKLSVHTVDEEEAETLVIGFDPDFEFEKLQAAVRVAENASTMIACSKDRTFPGEDASCVPGCGAMVSAIEWCSNRMVDTVLGKPNTFMLEAACEQLNLAYEEVLVVGDSYESDILMANKLGCPSVIISDRIYNDTVSVENIGELANLIG